MSNNRPDLEHDIANVRCIISILSGNLQDVRFPLEKREKTALQIQTAEVKLKALEDELRTSSRGSSKDPDLQSRIDDLQQAIDELSMAISHPESLDALEKAHSTQQKR